jgi:hypothetical protein
VCAAGATTCTRGTVTCAPTTAPSPEICNDGLDNDCNGLVDETGGTFYADADGDGHGNPATATRSCSPPPGFVTVGDDCDDNDNRVFPGQTAFFTARRPNNTFDYNCSGTDEPQFPQGLSCTSGPGGCQTVGTWLGSTVPACGRSGLQGACSTTCTRVGTVSATQACH